MVLSGTCLATFAHADGLTSTNTFQKFENEYNVGLGLEQGTLINGQLQTATFNAQAFNLEAEHLFDMGLWLDVNFNMVTNYSQPNLGGLNGGDGGNRLGNAFGQDPFMYSFTGKVGYAFNLIDNKLQLTPYAMFGRNGNWATSTVIANGYESLSSDYFLTGGLGARLSYNINDSIVLYLDEMYNYNWDNSGAIKSIQTATYGKSYAATNYQFISTIGAKFNITSDLQLGVSGFWTNFQPQSNISGIVYTPTNTFGEMVTVGLTY